MVKKKQPARSVPEQMAEGTLKFAQSVGRILERPAKPQPPPASKDKKEPKQKKSAAPPTAPSRLAEGTLNFAKSVGRLLDTPRGSPTAGASPAGKKSGKSPAKKST